MKATMNEVVNILNEYGKRNLEVVLDYHSNTILIYEYEPHTKDEEGGEFIAEVEKDVYDNAFEQVYNYTPKYESI